MALPDLGTFDPGTGDGWDESPLSTVDKLKRTAARAALDYNPLTALRTLQDVPRIAYNATVAPLASMWSIPGQGLQNKGAELLYGALGNTEEAQKAAARNANLQPADLSLPMQSASGQAAQEALMRGFEESKLAGAIGLHPTPSRGFTPNDLRVMGAEAARIGKQVRDIPSDFANAKAGITRVDPITNAPTLGTKLQSVAPGLDAVGELGPTAGSAAAQMGAIRVPGTQLVRAKNPDTGNLVTPTQAETADLGGLTNLQAAPVHTIDTNQQSRSVLGDYMTRYLDTAAMGDAFNTYSKQRMMEMYPDATSPRVAQLAFEARLGGRSSNEYADARAQIIDDFAKTPEAQQLAQAQGTSLPTVEDYFNRHEAGMKWVANNLTNYASKYVGTANDPLLKAASEGYTFRPAADVRSQGEVTQRFADTAREKAGMPGSALQTAIDAKQTELDQATQNLNDFAQANVGNLEATNATTRMQNARIKIANELENLKLGAMYENLADTTVSPVTKEKFLIDLAYPAKQFYPDVTHPNVPDAATLYKASRLNEIGLPGVAQSVYSDVMQGKIPLDKLSVMPVEKYVRQIATKRMQDEAAAVKAQQQYLTNATAAIADRTTNDPAAQQIGGHILLETTANTPRNVAVQRVSDATAVLDMCVGESGKYAGKGPHPFTGNDPNYEPYLDPITGEKNPKGTGSLRNYVDNALGGNSILAQIHDNETKLPVAMLELHKRGSDKYSLGYVSGPTTKSGATNGPIAAQYHQAIADYLNKRGDIVGVESNLGENTSVLDTARSSDAARMLGLRSANDLAAAHPDLPRFMTKDALRTYAATLKQEQQATPQLPTARSTDTLQSLQQARDVALRDLNDLTNTHQQTQDALAHINDIDARIARIGTDQRLATNYATPSEYNFNDFAGVYGDNLSSNERRAGQAAVDYIHHYFDERSLQDNYLYVRQQVGDPAIHHVEESDEARRVFAGLSTDTRDAVIDYFRELHSNDNASMPRILTRMTAEDLHSQLSDPDRLAVPMIANQLGRRYDANPQHYPTILAFVDEMRHDRPLHVGTNDRIEPAVLESALRQLAHERMAGAPAAPAAPAQPVAAQADVAMRPWVMEEIQRVLAADGVQIGERVETVLHRIMENHDPDREPASFVTALFEAAGREQNALVEENLTAIANRVTGNGDGWEVDPQHGANQPAAAAAAPQEDALAARMERLRNGEFAASLGANLRAMPYGELSRSVLRNADQFNLVADAATRIMEQTRTHGIDNPDEVTNLIRNGNRVFGGATLQLDTFTPNMLELLARDVGMGMTARNNAARPAQLPAEREDILAERHAEMDAERHADLADERIMADAQQLLEILDESVFSTMARPTAMRQIRGSIRDLENNGNAGWENVIGMASEDYPYNTTLRDALVAQLRMLLEGYE